MMGDYCEKDASEVGKGKASLKRLSHKVSRSRISLTLLKLGLSILYQRVIPFLRPKTSSIIDILLLPLTTCTPPHRHPIYYHRLIPSLPSLSPSPPCTLYTCLDTSSPSPSHRIASSSSYPHCSPTAFPSASSTLVEGKPHPPRSFQKKVSPTSTLTTAALSPQRCPLRHHTTWPSLRRPQRPAPPTAAVPAALFMRL